MNTVQLVGRIASDITCLEVTTAKGKTVKASFLLAVRRAVRGATEPDWVRIETWGKQAENLVKFNGKGSKVAVTGRIRGQFYNPDGGKTGGQLRTSVVADEIVYLTSPKGTEAAPPAGPAEAKGTKA